MNESEVTETYASERSLLFSAVSLTIATCALAVLAWGQDMNWHFNDMSMYQIFPVLGLLAFSIMWSQYVIEACKNYLGHDSAIKSYFTRTSFLVLLLIVLHPGLLVAQLFRDGFGLPPGSYKAYVAPAEVWLTTLGAVSLLMFLAFEFKRFFGDKHWWRYVIMLNDVAIVAIYYHGLRLGQETMNQWYQIIWYAYGVILLAVLIYKYYYTYRVKKSTVS